MTSSLWQNPRSCHTQRSDSVSHWNTSVKGENKYRKRQKIIYLDHFPLFYPRKPPMWLLGTTGSNSNIDLPPMHSSARDKAPDTAWMSLQSPCQCTDGETFVVLFSVSLWTHSSLLKSVRNYRNSLSQSVIIFVRRSVAHGFSISPRFGEGVKGKRLLICYCWVALSNTSRGKNTSVAKGNYTLKVFLFWGRKLSLKWWSLIPSVKAAILCYCHSLFQKLPTWH